MYVRRIMDMPQAPLPDSNSLVKKAVADPKKGEPSRFLQSESAEMVIKPVTYPL